jgi:hypothetical protein
LQTEHPSVVQLGDLGSGVNATQHSLKIGLFHALLVDDVQLGQKYCGKSLAIQVEIFLKALCG